MQRFDLLGAVRAASCLLVILSIAACSGSGEDATSVLALDIGELVETTVTGSVGDGPITNGRVVIENSSGQVLATQRSDEQANYRIQLNAGRNEFPLLVRVDDGIDIVTGDAPSFELVSAIMQPEGERIVNLNPFGTLAVKVAQRMDGGLSEANLSFAVAAVKRHLGFGIDARILGNPMFIILDEQNTASVVRSSEALGEAIRRVYSALLSTGQFASTEAVVDSLSADLVDGVVDGSGAPSADSRLAATMSIVSAQVMLETMVNRLEVGGVVATQALDSAIQQVAGGNLTVPLTGTLHVTDSVLAQARVLVDAASRIDNNPNLLVVRDAVAQITPGQSAGQVAAILPPNASAEFDATIQRIGVATTEELARVNDKVSAGSPPDDQPINRLPQISGAPPVEVVAGTGYEFMPMASDGDGDALTFTAAGLPAWTRFDPANGRLLGVPTEGDAGTSLPIQISVSDGFGIATLPVFRITVVRQPNRLPTISGTAAPSVTVGNLYEFAPTAEDPDDDPLSFVVTNLPGWATFDPSTGRLSGVPGMSDAGVLNGIQISVSDGEDRASLAPFSITVSGIPNQVPTIAGVPSAQIMVGNSYVFTPSASDPNGDALTFSILGLPSWADFDGAIGRLSGTPAARDEGVYSGIRISVSDDRDTVSLPLFTITVDAVPNTAPIILRSPGGSVTVGSDYTFVPSAFDADGDRLTFSIAGRPPWMSFSSSTGALYGTPAASDVGTYSDIRISVTDGQETAALLPFSITVDAVPNTAPTIAGTPSGSVTVGSTYVFTPIASDPDGDSLVFLISGLPGWAVFDAASGALSGIPGVVDVGPHSGIRISVSDGQNAVALPGFAIAVSDVPNAPPTISGNPPAEVTVDQGYSFTPTASDADGDALIFSIAGLPGWASFDASTGWLSGAPKAGDAGTYAGIAISVSDGADSASLPAFSIAVNALPNAAPTITGNPPSSVTVGTAYSFMPTANDADGDVLTFSIIGLPTWASFDAGTGRLWGTPAVGEEGIFAAIVISVSDGQDSATLPAFSIIVDEPPNTAPTIEGEAAKMVSVGEAYSFTPTANDADGDPLTFLIVGLPVWASFDTGTGGLVGTPAGGDEGVYANIVITVSDGEDAASLTAFSITVNEPPKQAPVISGAPATQVTVDSTYSFRPTASDADGDVLTFSIVGMPAWASFDAGTGQLSGIPAAGEEGIYANVGISVSDGKDSASLPAFSITVNERPNQAPVISGAPATQVMVESNYSFTPVASDPDGDPLTFSIVGLPAWASFDAGTGQLSGTPSTGEGGEYSNVGISVSDGRDSASLPVVSITVIELPNRPPTIAGTPAVEVVIGSMYEFMPSADDPDNDNLTFAIAGLPAWASFDTTSGRLWGSPVAGDEATYAGIRISVSDGTVATNLAEFSVAVVAQALGSALLRWTPPMENADGSFLTDLAGYKVYYGTTVDSMNTVKTIDNPALTSYLVENLPAGEWFFKVTAFDMVGNESVDSNVAGKLVLP